MQEEYFSVISKTQLANGSYAPASRLSEKGRAQHRSNLTGQKAKGKNYYHRFAEQPKGWDRNRDLRSVYARHGVEPGLETALSETTRRSKKHPTIEYGSSITPESEAHLDRMIDPRVARLAKAPVVVHHGRTLTEAYAAASGPHVTNGHKGRVILNETWFHQRPTGMTSHLPGGMFAHEAVNHELAHAVRRVSNPKRGLNYDGSINSHTAFGEEARADATGVHGTGLYERTGVIQPESHLDQAEMNAALGRHAMHGAPDAKSLTDAIKAQRRYRQVHQKVQAVHGTRNPHGFFPPTEDKPFRRETTYEAPAPRAKTTNFGQAARTGRRINKPLFIGGAAAGVGLAVGSKAIYDHYHRDHSGKFAPGANPSLRKH